MVITITGANVIPLELLTIAASASDVELFPIPFVDDTFNPPAPVVRRFKELRLPAWRPTRQLPRDGLHHFRRTRARKPDTKST